MAEPLVDPITFEPFSDPVLVPCCGQTFSRASIVAVLNQNNLCPLCRAPCRESALLPNRAIEALLEAPRPSQWAISLNVFRIISAVYISLCLYLFFSRPWTDHAYGVWTSFKNLITLSPIVSLVKEIVGLLINLVCFLYFFYSSLADMATMMYSLAWSTVKEVGSTTLAVLIRIPLAFLSEPLMMLLSLQGLLNVLWLVFAIFYFVSPPHSRLRLRWQRFQQVLAKLAKHLETNIASAAAQLPLIREGIDPLVRWFKNCADFFVVTGLLMTVRWCELNIVSLALNCWRWFRGADSA
eukprot:TRINITY_DN8464_c0_g1_i3.p1 TRINITY_DN8464_c0_g1~~TRINITY_DN8464_c0_g1_i3.p1  ORF type:complete len:296 (+),score=5.16 TRINITY_DN8464_c0_g1_i3:49-936(+)